MSEDEIPDGDFNVGYFEGNQHKKKWLVSGNDLEAMYTYYKGKEQIKLWCDGKQKSSDSGDEERPRKKRKTKTKEIKKVSDQEEELECVFQRLKEKHDNKWSGPQYRLWARAIVSGIHDNEDKPPNSPMFTGSIQKQQKESLSDAFASAATAIAKVFSPGQLQTSGASSSHSVNFSPSKKVEIRMKNLEQLRVLQSLMEDGILNREEFCEQKRIVLQSLSSLS